MFTFHNTKNGLCLCEINWMGERSLPGAKSLSWSKVTKRQQQISLRKGKSLMLSTDWVGWKCPKKSPIYPNCSPDVYLTSTSSPRTLGFFLDFRFGYITLPPDPNPHNRPSYGEQTFCVDFRFDYIKSLPTPPLKWNLLMHDFADFISPLVLNGQLADWILWCCKSFPLFNLFKIPGFPRKFRVYFLLLPSCLTSLQAFEHFGLAPDM